MALTDTQIRKAKSNGKVQKLNDGDGLRLEISKAGTKSFKYRYQVNGKDSNITLGAYPALSLAEARIKRDEVKAAVRQGINPIQQKQQAKAEQQAIEQTQQNRLTLTQLFEQWHDHNEGGWNYKYATDVRNRITIHLLPVLGDQFIDEITPQQVIFALKQMEAKGLGDSIRKVQQYTSRMFRYGVGLGLCSVDPVRDIPAGDIFKKQTKQNLHHLTKPADLYQLLNAIDTYLGDISTATALKLAPHVFLRPAELAGLRWSEVDLNNGLITIEANRMKMKRPHVVPLSRQAKELIQSMQPISGSSEYVFVSPRSQVRPINEQSINAGLKRLGFGGKQTAHGFRHTASTLLNEQGFNRDWIEMQLAHASGDSVRGTYNKAEYLSGRTTMMQAWSDYLDGIKAGADVVPINRSGA
ncbi:tyrosine-type recombinase/integrase [Thiomicrorhabdus xiamenensis]|uniref:Tyrosine-type recombinase/integrase n=1 Tax=Thiomicrorhabdus xiamenensis TaxID=2739063 RepID=A0A7D4TDY5_9GAMM|nr:tyrosine-type recombinase/integrase [Thiomicrorhabdus xiamenensis]QKI88967.1 tyrosine-type recombinase/integrase [Thiomicrorhabdus xiamenensis]